MSVAPSGARQHADMHPATKARVDAGAAFGRKAAALIKAVRDEMSGLVTEAFVDRADAEYTAALEALVVAAQEEGAFVHISRERATELVLKWGLGE